MFTNLEIGLLQAIEYLMVILIAVAAAMGWTWEMYPLLGLAVITVPYAVWREIRNIERSPIKYSQGGGESSLSSQPDSVRRWQWN